MKNIFSTLLACSLLLPALALTACQPKAPATGTISDAYGNTQTAVTTTPTPSSNSSMQTQPPKTGDTIATIETDKGIIKFKLFTDLAPLTTKNFIDLAKAGKYDNVPFHRIIKDFMIQTGDFTNKNGTGGYAATGPGTYVKNEVMPELKHLNGTVSMANAGPNTNGSQFFIVTSSSDKSYLNNNYSVFGQVFEGQDVADAISKVPTGPSDNPLTPLNMKKVTISTF
jgi:cyclophilin family peptidyl-prolyl cis-trans isomerase